MVFVVLLVVVVGGVGICVFGSSIGGLGIGIGGIGGGLGGIDCGVGGPSVETVCHSDKLGMYYPKEPLIKEAPHKGSNIRKGKKDGLLGIVERSYKADDLMMNLEDKNITKHYREKLCLVWFVYSILLAKDVRKVIEDDLLTLANDFEKFIDYPWGYDSYYLTVEYLLTKLCLKMITLYGFPWAFMAWACEAISPLRKQFKVYPNEVSHLGILRWLAAKGNMSSVATDGSSIAINYPSTATGATDGVVDNGGSHADVATTANRDYEHVGTQEKINMFEKPLAQFPYSGPSHPFSPSCSHCKYKVCKDREDKLFEKLEAIFEAVEELKSKRDVIPSKKLREPYTPIVACLYSGYSPITVFLPHRFHL
ncbi:putative glycerol-3-phosphate 2-O-acyltransferase 6-like [Capsicum annuum]|nr:putative glycerol-3-phosphate 2-O-acyltransferase 6-like [Capsicum annuum]KAF3623584.1 putative glycerol-3-phosphate 2-O-acyltransferase 6-like [Capsicum annuum]